MNSMQSYGLLIQTYIIYYQNLMENYELCIQGL